MNYRQLLIYSSPLCCSSHFSRLRARPRVRVERAAQSDDRRPLPLAVPEDAQLDAGLQERHLVEDTEMCSR